MTDQERLRNCCDDLISAKLLELRPLPKDEFNRKSAALLTDFLRGLGFNTTATYFEQLHREKNKP